MFQTQTRWKLSALLLAAPLLAPAVAHADYDQGYTATEIVNTLKGYKWQNAKGEVYLFRKDGQFESRPDPEFAKAYVFVKDFGRFTVRPARQGEALVKDEKFVLQMNITSSIKKSDKKGGKDKVVQRTATVGLPIKMMSKYTRGGDEYDSDLYALIGGERFRTRGKL